LIELETHPVFSGMDKSTEELSDGSKFLNFMWSSLQEVAKNHL
jgi:hypothetical protein